MPENLPPSRPAILASLLEGWFAAEQRPLPWRRSYDAWEVLVSETMLQQTRMEVVLEYFPRFLNRFPDLGTLAGADLEEVLAAWSGLGYYRRARMLKAAADAIAANHGGRVPSDNEALRKLPGIGRYTANAIASIAFDARVPVVEGNVTRLLSRLDELEGAVGSASLSRRLWAAAEEIVLAAASPRMVNQAMMELGSVVCRPRNPLCGECPLFSLCGGAASGRQEGFPRPAARRASRRLAVPLYLVEDDGKILMRREPGTLMTGMAHLPHGNDLLLAPMETIVFRPGELVGTFRHTITNRRIEFAVYRAEADLRALAESSRLEWVSPSSLARIPHPSYVRKALRLAGISVSE